MTRIRLAAAGLAVTAVATLGAGMSQAIAAGFGTQQQASAPGTPAAQESADLSVIRGKYWTRDGCMTAGRDGVARGDWSQFQCADGLAYWVLWTDR